MPESRAYTMDELMEGIIEAFSRQDITAKYKEKRRELCTRMWKYTDGRSCERILRKASRLIRKPGKK